MRLLLEIFGQTLRTLWAHKLRSFLTMFGIAWGVGSLLLLVGLGEGFRSGNKKQFDELGENVMFIWGGRAPAMKSRCENRHACYFAQRCPRGERLFSEQRTADGRLRKFQSNSISADVGGALAE